MKVPRFPGTHKGCHYILMLSSLCRYKIGLTRFEYSIFHVRTPKRTSLNTSTENTCHPVSIVIHFARKLGLPNHYEHICTDFWRMRWQKSAIQLVDQRTVNPLR